MRLKAIYHGDELCLATEAGEIIEFTDGCRIFSTGMDAMAGKRVQCHFSIIVNLETPVTIVDADERSVRALPTAPQDPFDFLKGCYDFDPYDYEDFPRDDDEEDFMDGLCPDCVQELCLHCGQCCTPACEAENCDCP